MQDSIISNGSSLFWCTDWMGCSVTPAGSNFGTSWFAGCSRTGWNGMKFGDGRELFDTGLKYLNKLIKNTWRNKIEINIFVIHKALPKFMKILSREYLEPYGNHT